MGNVANSPGFSYARALVRPGITGLWQVRDRNHDTHIGFMWPHDLEYVDTFSPMTDLKVMIRTAAQLLGAGGGRAASCPINTLRDCRARQGAPFFFHFVLSAFEQSPLSRGWIYGINGCRVQHSLANILRNLWPLSRPLTLIYFEITDHRLDCRSESRRICPWIAIGGRSLATDC